MAKVISAKAATQDQQKKNVQTVKVQMKPGTNFQSSLSGPHKTCSIPPASHCNDKLQGLSAREVH